MTIYTGDCREIMREFLPETVDAIVTDPPYGLGFMGKDWDRSSTQAEHLAWASEAYRIAKPGAHLLAFGGTRTFHRLACAIEDAGWEIRDCLVWAYASGFPKSRSISKSIDRMAGAPRALGGVSGTKCADFPAPCSGHVGNGRTWPTHHARPTVATTDDAKKWDGWGTALKPAWEPIVLARKRTRGTVAANVLAYGTGALNIDGTRIAWTDEDDAESAHRSAVSRAKTMNEGRAGSAVNLPTTYAKPPYEPDGLLGRWPANVVLTDPVFDALDEDGESYSRFFLIPKADRTDREPILASRALPASERPRANGHPTVKPVELMRHLVRLVTPPGGTVLDPFAGSGSTLLAAEMEGFPWIGIEMQAEYVAIAQARLPGTQRGLGLG